MRGFLTTCETVNFVKKKYPPLSRFVMGVPISIQRKPRHSMPGMRRITSASSAERRQSLHGKCVTYAVVNKKGCGVAKKKGFF